MDPNYILIDCLGAFQTPVTSSRGQPRDPGVRKPTHKLSFLVLRRNAIWHLF
jgi:hypothetical protein